MYSKVKLLEKNDEEPYVFARMKVTVTNNLDDGKLIGKLVFPISNFNFYYQEGSSKVHVDDIKASLKQESHVSILKIERLDFTKKDKNLKLVSYLNSKDHSYIMDKGFD